VTSFLSRTQISKEESRLDFSKPAAVLHNQVRGFAGWPGAFATFQVSSSSSGSDSPPQQQQELQVKILESRHIGQQEATSLLPQAAPGQVVFLEQGKRMFVQCTDGGALEVLQLQPPTKKAMQPKAFFNGLGGKQLSVQLEPCAAVA
jgi:methionyl-tRNA formyltransferase